MSQRSPIRAAVSSSPASATGPVTLIVGGVGGNGVGSGAGGGDQLGAVVDRRRREQERKPLVGEARRRDGCSAKAMAAIAMGTAPPAAVRAEAAADRSRPASQALALQQRADGNAGLLEPVEKGLPGLAVETLGDRRCACAQAEGAASP